MRLWVALALAAALVAGCGDDGADTGTPAAELAVPWIDPDGDPPIVGSLSVNPSRLDALHGHQHRPVPHPGGRVEARAGGRPARDA